MAVKNLVEKKTRAPVEEEESDSESEIEFDYNDAEEDDDDDDDDDETSEEESDSEDPETEDSEAEEADTTQASGRKKDKNSKLKRSAESEEDDNDANDASGEDDDSEEIDDDDTTEEPKKKKRKKMSKLDKSTDNSEDDGESEGGEEEDASDNDDDEDDDESEGEEVKAHKGFANALSNILNKKTVSSKKVILAQGKTDKEIKQLKDSKLPPEEQETKEPYLTPLELEAKRLKRKLWLEMGKVRPKPLERNRERDLKMIATRGVVQLFNAVKKQQKMVNDNLSGAHSERRKDMVIESMNKKSFINLLQNTKVDVSMATAEKDTPMAKEPARKIWSVLKDDFVIGTGKMKDWDKQDDMDDL